MNSQSINTLCYATALTASDISAIKAARKSGITGFTTLVTECKLEHKILSVATYLGIARENIAKYVHPRMYCRVETYLNIEGIVYPPSFPQLLRTELGASFSSQGIYRYDQIRHAYLTYAHRLTKGDEDISSLTEGGSDPEKGG